MEREQIRKRLASAINELEQRDAHLFENDLSERCIASRLAMYLQKVFSDYSVDVEYNRKGELVKRLHLPEECANDQNDEGESIVIPDVIVHHRGEKGPNLLVLELKKTTNADSRNCDHLRIHAFREQLGYNSAALIECETRPGRKPAAVIIEFF